MIGKNLPGYGEFQRVIVAAESADGLVERRGSLSLRALRGPNTRKTDGRPQLKYAGLLLFRRRDGLLEFAHRFVEIRGIEPQQTFRAQPMDFRKKESDARLLDRLQNHIQRLECPGQLPVFEPNVRDQARVEWRERARLRNQREFRFHHLEAAGEIALACTDPSGHEGGDRSLWRQIELVGDFDHSLRQPRDGVAIADDLIRRHRVHACERQAGWIIQSFAERDASIDDVFGLPRAAELREPHPSTV